MFAGNNVFKISCGLWGGGKVNWVREARALVLGKKGEMESLVRNCRM